MKFLKIFAGLFIVCLALNAQAFSIFSKKTADSDVKIVVTSYPHFYPLGYTDFDSRGKPVQKTIFSEAIKTYFPLDGYTIEYKPFETKKDAAMATRQGHADVFLGAYYDSDGFEGVEFVFPAVFNNPVHVIMMADKISSVKNLQSLRDLKGVYSLEDQFNDYMLQTFEKLNVKPIATTQDAYKALILGEVDYIFGTYYYHYAHLVENGLKNYVAFSKTPLWNMPLFIAVSKASEKVKAISAQFKKLLSTNAFRNKVLQDLKEQIKTLEIQSQGVVAPLYVKEIVDQNQEPDTSAVNEGKN